MKARFFLLSDSSSMFESMCRLRAWWGSAAKTCMLLSNGILFSEDRRDKCRDHEKAQLRKIVEG